MAGTTATVMVTAKTTTGKDNDDNGQGHPCQWARTATTTGKDNDVGKDGKRTMATTARTTGEDGEDNR